MLKLAKISNSTLNSHYNLRSLNSQRVDWKKSLVDPDKLDLIVSKFINDSADRVLSFQELFARQLYGLIYDTQQEIKDIYDSRLVKGNDFSTHFQKWTDFRRQFKLFQEIISYRQEYESCEWGCVSYIQNKLLSKKFSDEDEIKLSIIDDSICGTTWIMELIANLPFCPGKFSHHFDNLKIINLATLNFLDRNRNELVSNVVISSSRLARPSMDSTSLDAYSENLSQTNYMHLQRLEVMRNESDITVVKGKIIGCGDNSEDELSDEDDNSDEDDDIDNNDDRNDNIDNSDNNDRNHVEMNSINDSNISTTIDQTSHSSIIDPVSLNTLVESDNVISQSCDVDENDSDDINKANNDYDDDVDDNNNNNTSTNSSDRGEDDNDGNDVSSRLLGSATVTIQPVTKVDFSNNNKKKKKCNKNYSRYNNFQIWVNNLHDNHPFIRKHHPKYATIKDLKFGNSDISVNSTSPQPHRIVTVSESNLPVQRHISYAAALKSSIVSPSTSPVQSPHSTDDAASGCPNMIRHNPLSDCPLDNNNLTFFNLLTSFSLFVNSAGGDASNGFLASVNFFYLTGANLRLVLMRQTSLVLYYKLLLLMLLTISYYIS